MSIIYVLIPIAMLFVAIAVGIFFWAVKNDQYDDLDRQSVSILFDDKPIPSPSKISQKINVKTSVDDSKEIETQNDHLKEFRD